MRLKGIPGTIVGRQSMSATSNSGFQWKDKVVLITGASEGIGASCEKLIGQRGAKLSLTALPSASFHANSKEEGTCTRIVTTGDITDAETRRAVVDRTVGQFGRIDVLINDVGVGQYGYPSALDTEVSKRIFDINVFSPLALTQLVVPYMRRQGSGVIVNLGSVGGKVSLPWAVMYCATKWAVHCIDDSLRRELRPYGIRVVKVCPGIVSTGFRDHVLAGKAPEPVENIRRVVSPDQVAAALVRGVERNRRTVYVPRIGLLFTALECFAPAIMDWYLTRNYSRHPVDRGRA
jgi:short-subunit dehydrogenase